MDSKIILQSMISYHITAMRKTWDVILNTVDESDFVKDLGFSWGSLRNELVHVSNVDSRWLAGLREHDVPDHIEFEKFLDRFSAKIFSESVLEDLNRYCMLVSEAELAETPKNIPATRWQVLLHIVNHGTDHRARVLSMLNRLGKTEFDQDYIYYLMGKI